MSNTGKWILVVENDDDNREVMVEFLNDSGYPAKGVSGGAEAIEVLLKETPALVLADLFMDDMDGRELLTRTRSLALAAPPPFVFVTGAHPAKLEDTSCVVLEKPVDLKRLLGVVAHHCC